MWFSFDMPVYQCNNQACQELRILGLLLSELRDERVKVFYLKMYFNYTKYILFVFQFQNTNYFCQGRKIQNTQYFKCI